MEERVAIEGKALAVVIAGWLRRMPKWAWGTEPRYAKLCAEKRQRAVEEPRPRMIAAELIAAEMKRLGWEVTYEKPGPRRDDTGLYDEYGKRKTSAAAPDVGPSREPIRSGSHEI